MSSVLYYQRKTIVNTKYNNNGYGIPKGRTEYSERVEDDACLQANNKNLEIKINNSKLFSINSFKNH